MLRPGVALALQVHEPVEAGGDDRLLVEAVALGVEQQLARAAVEEELAGLVQGLADVLEVVAVAEADLLAGVGAGQLEDALLAVDAADLDLASDPAPGGEDLDLRARQIQSGMSPCPKGSSSLRAA